MGVFGRLASIFKANANGVINKLEDPERLLDQTILDMTKEYNKAKESISNAKGEELGLAKRIHALTLEESKWQNNAKLALKQNNEELAKQALVRKNEVEEELKLIRSDKDIMSINVDKLIESLKSMEKKISQAERKKKGIKARMNTAKAKNKITETMSNMNGLGDSAFDAFNRMEEKADGIINEADGREFVNDKVSGENLENQFADLSASSEVDADLEALKLEMEAE